MRERRTHLVLGLLLAAVAAAAPVRIVLPRVPDSRGLAADDSITPLIALYLRERLAGCSQIRPVSDGRATAVFAELTSGVREVGDAGLVPAFSAYLPVDAVLRSAHHDDQLVLRLEQRDGTKELTYALAGNPVRALLQQVGEDLATALSLPDSDRLELTEPRLKNDEVVQTYYYTQIISVQWPINPGETRLKILQTAFRKDPDSIALAARILEDAAYQVRATTRDQGYTERALLVGSLTLPAVLGTDRESAARTLVEVQPETFAKDLISLAKPLLADAADEMMGDLMVSDDAGAVLDLQAPDNQTDRAAQATRAQRLGALRTLGVVPGPAALKLLTEAAAHEQVEIRAAAAVALSRRDDSDDVLTKLAADTDAGVALTAGVALWQRQQPPDNLLGLARAAGHAGVLAALGETADQPALRQVAEHGSVEQRRGAIAGLARLQALDSAQCLALMDDTDEEIAQTAIRYAAGLDDAAVLQRLTALANDPHSPTAQAARFALRGKDVPELEVAHPYVRRQLIDQMIQAGDAQGMQQLAAACSNRDPQTRTYAMQELARLDPARARPLLLAAARDPYDWVRLHVAALLPTIAKAPDLDRVREALAHERDPATCLYLQDTIAALTGAPPPAAPPPARSVIGHPNQTWLCGLDSDVEQSPFSAYYVLNIDVSEEWQRCYKSGKIFFGRPTPVGNTGLIITDPQWQDRFWLSLNGQVTPAKLPFLDGVVYGEETMKLDADGLWPTGWPLFCRDAGIDADRVAGKLDNLTALERAAWRRWALDRCVDGFNRLYDYTKLRQGKLRPGLQVCTFLPGEQGNLMPADQRWKFDIGGLYDYKGCNRIAAYMLTRRMKTIWPERPVIWFSLGIGGYEMNPVKHNLKVPTAPIRERSLRAYADSVSAWLAGADVGWFSTWIFVAHDFSGGMHDLRGVQISVADIQGDPALVQRGIEYAFRGVAELRELKAIVPPTAKADVTGATGDSADLTELTLEDPEAKPNPILEQIAADKLRMFDGFQFYGQYVYDCARLFADLPRRQPQLDTLAIRPGLSVWTRGGNYADVPGQALLDQFDFLCDINKVTHLDLSKYKLIAVDNPGRLRDETIAALTEWLQQQQGVLYIHTNLSADNAYEAATPEDFDGQLTRDWPWEDSVTMKPLESKVGPQDLQRTDGRLQVTAEVSATIAVSGPAATVLLRHGEDPVLVVWQAEGFAGRVVFDGLSHASAEYLDYLRAVLVGYGLQMPALPLRQAGREPGINAVASSPYYRRASAAVAVPGIDQLTGERNPPVGGGRHAAVIASDFTGTYNAAHGGVVVLASAPLQDVQAAANGLSLKTAGLARIAAAGKLSVQAGGKDLPTPDQVTEWLIRGQTDGVVWIEAAADHSLGYVRSAQRLTLTAEPGE